MVMLFVFLVSLTEDFPLAVRPVLVYDFGELTNSEHFLTVFISVPCFRVLKYWRRSLLPRYDKEILLYENCYSLFNIR